MYCVFRETDRSVKCIQFCPGADGHGLRTWSSRLKSGKFGQVAQGLGGADLQTLEKSENLLESEALASMLSVDIIGESRGPSLEIWNILALNLRSGLKSEGSESEVRSLASDWIWYEVFHTDKLLKSGKAGKS